MLGTQYSTEFLLESNKEFISYDEFLNEFADCFNLKIIDFAKNLVKPCFISDLYFDLQDHMLYP